MPCQHNDEPADVLGDIEPNTLMDGDRCMDIWADIQTSYRHVEIPTVIQTYQITIYISFTYVYNCIIKSLFKK